MVGCELGGAVKNVIALAVGIADGMGLGDNARRLLITRGLAEIARLGAALGADPHTFAGLAGHGRPGRHLHLAAVPQPHLRREPRPGHDAGARSIAVTRQTAEGVKSCESVLELARRHGVEMPITEVVVGVVHDGMPPAEAGELLMSRSPKPERYGI